VERLVVLYLLLTVAAEITFTTYFSVYSEASMVGHLLRWTAYFLLYTAIVETALVNPYSILLRDLKRSEDNLRAHASDLQAQNEELDAYAHSVAHDLKNPLTVVIAAADVINGVANLTRDELREYLGQIKDTAFEMNSIVDDLLLLSEVRKAQVPLEPTDMAGVVEQVERRLRPLVTKHGGCLVFPRMWPTAMGYAPWLREVWANYITNALKYGGPSPRIELGFDRLPGGKIRFWTRDYGPGIRADAAASLFVPFRQLRSKAMGGHGLGLSIVLRIVEKLGGQVGAEGAAGQGSIFYFTLDAIPASAETLATSESADGRSTEAAPAD
jgi:two-component system sensor histidine kinase/response regulator